MLFRISSIIVVIICFSGSAVAQTYGDVLRERAMIYEKYKDKLNAIIPSGWSLGDILETKLKSQTGEDQDHIVLLMYKPADKPNKVSAGGMILIVQSINNELIKKWNSSEEIVAEDGIIGDFDFNRIPKDINKDGFEEIIVTFSLSKLPSQGLIHMWIYSWDGVQGVLISPKKQFGLGLVSLFTGSQLLPPALIDYDDDGIHEIIAESEKIYKWDSVKKTFIYWKSQN